MRDFPQELVDAVVEQCYSMPDGAATVKTCGLVCQQWLPRSRMHLFSRVMLDFHNLAPFIDIVDSSSFPVLSFVRHLTLRFVHLAPDDALLQKIIYHLPNLCRVEADICGSGAYREASTHTDRFYQSLQDYLEIWAFNSPSLTRFDFHGAAGHVLSAQTVIHVIKRIPSLEFLGIYGGSILAPARLPTPTHLPMSWHTLDVNVRHPAALLSRLLAPTLPPLTSLKLKIHSPGEDQSLEEYFECVGSQLASLSLSFSPNLGSEAQMVGRWVAHAPNLRTLKLSASQASFPLDVMQVLPPYEWDSIRFVLNGDAADGSVAWAEIDAALADARFSTLRRFSVSRSAATGGTSSMLMPQTMLLMPLALARGVLA